MKGCHLDMNDMAIALRMALRLQTWPLHLQMHAPVVIICTRSTQDQVNYHPCIDEGGDL